MKLPHLLRVVAVTALTALGLSAPVHAGGQGSSIDPDFTCDDSRNIELDIRGEVDDEFSVFIDDMDTPVDQDVSPAVVSFEVDSDGFYLVKVVDEADDRQVFFEWVGVACDGPVLLTDTDCEDSHLYIKIADDASYDYSISIDGTPATGWIPGDSDTDQDWFDLGVYPDGTHTVVVDGEDEGDAIDGSPFTLTVVIDCVEDADSGADIPTVGSSSTPLLAGAATFVVGGIALLGVRRLRSA